jgi:recombination protein RecA
VADAGVDLGALAVVRAPDPLRAARAADHLLRSGAFALMVLDIGENARMPLHVQTRLGGLCGKHDTALVCITEKESWRPSIGSLISVRAEAKRAGKLGDGYRCELQILKDKRRGPGRTHTEICCGPDGLS